MQSSGSYLNLDTVSLGTMDSARGSIAKLDEAIDRVAQSRGTLGSILNQLERTISFTDNSIENNANSESTIRDADMAVEVSRLTRVQVLTQAASAMLAQANAAPTAALTLLE